MTAMSPEQAWFESEVAVMKREMIDGPRKEADELCAGFEGDKTHVARVRRHRAGTLRTQATKTEKWIARARQLGLEDEEHRRLLVGDQPDVMGTYLDNGWSIDAEGRWEHVE